MSLPTRTVGEIREEIIANIEARVGQSVPILPKAFARVLAGALAGVVVLWDKYLIWLHLQQFAATADDQPVYIGGRQIIPLQEIGKSRGTGTPDAATTAQLDVTAIAVGAGPEILAGTQLLGRTNGYTYLVNVGVPVLAAGAVLLSVTAVADPAGGSGSGTAGNLGPGALIDLVTGVPHMQTEATVAAQTVTAADAEAPEDYRRRVVERHAKRSRGGAPVDYRAWATAVEGITHAYPYTAGPGRSRVYVEATPASSGSPDGFPTSAQIEAVKASIQFDVDGIANRLPMGAFIDVESITRRAYTVTVIGLANQAAEIKAAMFAGLAEYFGSREPYIGGLSTTTLDRVLRDEVGGVVAQIAAANGTTYTGALVRAPAVETVDFAGRITTGSSDATELGGIMTVGGATMPVGGATRITGFRFGGVNIPIGATVVAATLSLEAAAVGDTYGAWEISCEPVASSVAFSGAADDITDRAKGTAITTWIPPAWAANEVAASPDIAAAVDEVIGVDGWTPGAPITLFISGIGDRLIKAQEDSVGVSALLSVTYRTADGPLSTIIVDTLTRGQRASLAGVVYL